MPSLRRKNDGAAFLGQNSRYHFLTCPGFHATRQQPRFTKDFWLVWFGRRPR